ncbi:tandem-95 repeat protein [Vibrio kanaloae]|nr:tandem-95 repeat protein [Vibrio kanaloae]QPK06363.1 tandem-95 repeat protein [Vibrio kanaloae]
MAGENNQNNQNEDLNDAVEQTDTNDAGTPSQQQNQQNQQNTIATTIATGAENTDAADEVNQALEDNPSGAGNEEEASASGGAAEEETPESDEGSDDTQSNVVGGAASDASSDDASGSGGGSGAGAQAVGGENAAASEGGSDAEGNEDQGQAARTSAAPSAEASESDEQQTGDDLDSQTVEETFAVDVEASDEETISEVEDDFDSETVNETFKIKVESENDAPEAEQNLAYIMDEDGSITFTQEQLLEYASDVDGDELVASNVQVGADATVQENGDGTFTVVPSTDFNGELDLTFDISDGQETISSAIDLTVRPINDAPVPEDKTFEIEEDGTLIFTDADLLTGATDIEGDNLTVEGVTYDGGDGILTDNGNGTYTFAPNENFNGDVNFGFEVSDGTDTVSANIDVSVTAVDDAPVSGDLAYSVDEDGSIRLSQEQLLSQASDVEGDDLTASELSVGGNATVIQNDDGSFTITPDENFNGDIDISFDISDGSNTVQASADLTVNPVNDLPVPQDQQFSVEEDGTLIFTDADLLTGATDIEGDNLTVEGVTYDGGDGILTDNGNGTYTFAPNENFNGDVNFGFDVSDGTDTVSANIDVSVTAVDDAPVSGDLAYSIDEDGSIRLSQEQLLSQASDVEGDDLTASGLSVGGNATVIQNDDGSFTITPDENFNGDIDISFDISDGTNTVQASADLTVNPVNDLPVPQDQQFSVEEDGTLIFTDAELLTGATDIEGDNLTVEGVTYDGGDGILTDNGNGTYTFAPNENFNGDVNFNFDVSDGTDTVSANIDVSVTAVDDAPVSGDLAYSVDEDGSIRLSQEQLLSQASDVEGDDLTASGLTVGGDATVVANDDGSFTITPDEDFNGDIDISFDISDGTNTVQASADLTVNPVNDLPVPQDQQFSVEEDGTLIFTDADLLTGATDIEGDNLTVEGVTYDGGDGILTDNGNGTYTFAPNENFNGDVNFGFDVSDGTDTVSANIDVSVTAVDDAPVSGDLAYSIDEDGSIRLSQEQLLSQASDVEGDDLTASGLTVGGDATVTQNDDGSFTITPDENFNGDIDISFDIADGTNTVQASADLTVNPVNDLPVPQDQQFSVEEDGTLIFTDADLLTGATDIEGDNLTVEGVTYDGGDGILTDNGNGTYTFAPNENFNGDVNFGFDVSDGTDTVSANIDVSVTAVDDAPVSGDLAYSIDEDGSIRLSQEQLLSQASDVEGDDLTASSLTVGGDATVVANDDGSFTITPDENFNGDIDISFDISDGTNTVQASADLTVNPVNDLPVPQDQQFSIAEDGTLQFTDADLLTGATDVEGDNLTVEGITYEGTDGVLTDLGEGSYSFAPNENFNGDVSFSFDVSDGTDTVSANIDVSVTPENDPPVAGSTSYTVNEDNSITISDAQLLATSSDIEGDVSIDSVTYSGSDGVLEINGNGTYIFSPNENFSGEIALDVVVADEDGATDATTAGINVLEVNDPPVAGPTSYTIDEDSVLTFSESQVLLNASDVEGDVELVGISYDGPDGIFSVNGDGTCSFAPNENFNGQVQLDVTIRDEDGAEVETVINVDVLPINDVPVSGDLAYNVNEDGSITLSQDQLLSQASDVEGEDLTASDLTVNGNAAVTANDDGSFTIVPDANFNGDIDIQFNITDGTNTVQATADLTVNPVNDLPVPQDQQFSVEEDGTLIFTDADLLTGATDIEGDNLTVEGVTYDGGDGILTDNGNGTYTFAPNENFNGDVNFGFDVSDGTDTVSANIDVSVTAVDDAPVSGDLAYSIDEDGSIRLSQEQLLSQASDVEGDDLTASGLSVGGNATVIQNDDGSFTITPDENFNGDIDISFDISDGTNTVQASADLTVNPVNDMPVPQDQQFSVEEDGTLIFTDADLLTGATDIEGDNLTVEGVTYDGGDGILTDNGNGTYTFAPNENFNGDVNFGFDVSDGTNTVQASADLTVNPVNDLPVPQDQQFSVEEDGTLIFTDADLLTGATDIEGDNLTVEAVTYDGGDGILTDNGNGTYTFAPNENFNGDVNFGFEVSDGTDTVSANIDVSVTAVDDAPVSGDLAYSVDEDGSIRLSQEQLLSQASDVEGDDLTASSLTVDGDATVVANDDGSFTITPDENFNGDIDISFDISDGTNTVQASADLTVNPVNDLPVPQDQQFSIAEDGTLQFTDADLLTGATDVEGDNLTVEGITYEGTDGVLTDLGEGSYSFAPNENFNGDVSFSFDVSDGTDTVSANIDVSVTPENDPPVAGSTSYTVNEDNSITISDAQLLATSSDIEGDVSIDSVTYSGSDGVLEINGNGTYIFSPNENFSGEIALDVVVADEDGATDATTAGINVLEVNDPPVAGPTSYTIDEDSVLTFSESQVLLNASDVEGDVELVGISYDGPDGIFSVNGDGTCSFAPNENFNGQVQLDVTIRDEDGAEVETVINVDVLPINDVPVSGDLAYNVNEDGSITLSQDQLLSQASDVEGEDLTASDLTVNGNAAVTANDDGSFTIVPDANFNGDIDIQFNITDGTDTVQATADLTVNPVNDLPVPQDQQFSIAEDGTLQFTDADLLTGASDIDGEDLTVEGISYTGGDGVLTDHGDGTYTFAPNENFNGDVNFSFDVSDGTDTVSANIDVSVTPENDPPVAGSTSYMVNEDNAITISDEQLLANSSDVEGAVSVDSVTYSGTDGVFQDNGDGSYTFLPNENFSGDISLDVIVADEDGSIDETTAGITVLEVNDPPVAGPTSYTIDEDSVLTFSESQILVNASDIEGEVELVGINYDGSDGIFTVNGDGTCSFAPNENFNGQVQLGVTIQDEDGATVETQINVDVLPINDAPVSGDLAYTINEDSSITLSQEQLLARAGDIDSDNLEAINLSTDENATIQHNDDGSYTITPNADYNGDLDLNFDIIDNDGGEVQVGLDITVNPLNDLPQAQDQQFTIEEDGTLLFTDADLLAGASDIDGDELSIENVLYTGADGVLSDIGDGTYSFAPNENFNGDVQFSFDVFDGTDSTSAVIDVSVTPENDPPVAGSTSYTVQEDGQITISDEQLLANSSDVEGDVSLSGVSYSGDDGSFVDNGNGTYTFTPNENFDGDISLDVVVVDEDGATATTTAGIDVIAVNDGPETSGIQAEVDEDNSITITQEQLLANATDIEGDELTATNLQTNDPDATIVANDDGSFTITHTENFNGELDFTYSISDGENEVLTTLDLTVNPVNDAPEAGEEIFIQAEEDQTVGVTLREEPALRLDQAPENGIIEANVNDEWVVLEVGQEVPADTEVRFVPSEGALAEGTHTTQIGTFDDNASVDDWGTEVDPYTREFSDGDLTVTVQSNDEPLGAWNGNTHIGHGIGDTDRQGLSGDEKLTVSVEGQDINEISFHLDGLGGWFMEESRHFTEVEIRAFNDDGELIDSMTYHKEDRSNYETDYTLTTSEPVSYFELGTVQGNGTYVVQNMTVSQTCPDEAVFTSIGVDGSEITETVELNIHAGDSEIELTADLPNITVDTEGSAQFASVVITEEQLLAQASDIDGDDLDIQNLELVGENSEHATLTDNGDGTWTVTPGENFHGEIELGYQVTDGELTDSNIININFESVNDAPIVSGPIVLSTDEDQGITFSADDLLVNTTDVEGDALSISDITYGGDDGDLIDNGDGTFTFMPNENFNGEIDIDYKVFDGTDEVATHLDLTVVPVNDVPVPGEPLHTQMLENGSMIIEAKDLLSGATDVDGDILHVENLLLADQTQGTLTDNGDNTFTFEPTENFSGEVNLTFDISDGQASAPSTATVDVEIVNEGPEVSGPIEAAVDEDGSITITQEDLLANATDIDGDNLQAVNLATNDPNAVIAENSDGSFTITPSADFFGEIEFTYDVTDAIETVAADLNLTVNPINDAPDVPDMSFTTEDGQAITITEAELLAQATDVEGDELSVVNVTSASDTVEVTDNGDGTYTLTPEQGFFGNVDLAFDVSDGTDVVAANIDLKVEFVNDAPEATPMVADVDEDGSILVTQEMLLENASDQDGDELFATSLETNDPNASIVDNGDGTYTVTPSENFNGDIAFTYEVSDGELSTSNDMTLTVNPVNDIPIVAPGMYHIEEDGSILFTQEDLLSGAIDIDGDDLSVTSINYSGDEGTITDNGDGTFSFVPEEHFSGDLQFSFTVTDGTDEVEQDINVHIEAVADAPDLVITDGDGVNVDDEAILVEPGGIVELNIAAALVDQDLSETLTVTVDGVPEGSVIQYDNEGVLNDQENGITSYNDTEITVTFEGETAGYQNAAGYYKVDEDGNITGVEVVYENASQVGGGGDLVPGQDQFSFQVAEGESFNLFLIPNGHQHNDFNAMQEGQYEFRAEDGSPANMDTVDPQLIFIGADGTETVVQGENGDAIFHGGSSSQLNQDGLEHTRTTVNEGGELVYGFEDLYGGGDADYADFNFTIDVGEVNSQIYSGEVTVGPDGTVNLPTTAIENSLQIQLPEDFNEQLEVHVTATATELSNDDSETVSQTIYINATGAHIEHAPEALPVAATVEEDGSITITQEDLLANARDLDGDQLTALNLATDDESVTITDNGDGTYTLTPDTDFNGDVSFTFDVSDGDDVVSTNLELTVSPVNDGPEAQDQTFTVGEDGVLTFNDQDLLTGATDIEGDDLSVEGVTYTGTDGVLTDNGDGTYSFAPNENFNGDVNFSFNVSDGTDTVTANIDVSVTPENDPPVAGNTSYTVHEDNSITISNEQLLANSSDIEGEVAIDSVTYTGSDGVLEINGDGTYTFSPNENFNGEVSLDVVVVDEDDAAVSTIAGITVLEVDDPPVAGPTSYTIDEDSVLTFNESQILLNASDIEGDVELVEINYDGPDGIFSINGDGTCSFAPNENFNGQVQLDVTIQDEDGAQVDTYITVDVLPINDVPVSGDLAYSVEEDGSITLSQEQLLAQASDIEGDDLTAANLTVGGDAIVTANDDGSFTITPDANFNGDIDLTFDINDGTDTFVATADLTVNPVNDLPQPQAQTFSIGEDGIFNFTDEDLLTGTTDIDGDDLSVEGVTYTGADGVLTDNGDGTYSFAPNENFNGDVNFSFDVSDGTDTVQANIDVSVTPENDPPVAGSTSYTVHEDNSITISNEQLLANSSDIEGEVAIDSVTYTGSDGVFEDNGDGTYTFSPNENFNGEVSLDVVVTDEDGTTESTTAGVTVLEVNDPPIAGSTSYSVNEDEVITISAEQLLANASDIEGEVAIDSVTYTGADGIFTDNGNGTFSFAPNANFDGDVSLDVVVTDEDGATATTTASIDVLPVNDAPVSGDLAYSVEEDGSITLSQEQLLAQASDIEGDDLTAANLTVGGDATVTANDDGSFTITPDANFNGDIDLAFDINDGTDTLVATADLTVNPVNDLPQPQDQTFSIGEDGILNFTDEDLLTGATDIDGDDLSVEGVTYTGADGVLTDNGDGTYSFAPNENFNGDVNFSFDVSDGTDTVQANIDVSVTPENDPPVAGSTSYTVHEDNSITISNEQLLANSSDIEGEVVVDSVTYTGSDGVFEDNGDGTYTFSPNENFNGEVSLDVVVTDEDGTTESTTAGVTVLEVNDPPIAGSTSYSVSEDEVITISAEQLLANASDIEGEVAIDSVTYTGSDGIFTDNGDGTFSFAPNANFDGDVSLDVVVTDEEGATVATNASIDVLPVNDAPVSGDLAYSIDEDGSITLSQEQLLAQAADVDGDDLTASNLSAGDNATVVDNGDGTFTVTPGTDFNGNIDLNFDISDGTASIVANADLTVNPVNDLPTTSDVYANVDEDNVITITQEQLLANAADIEGDDLVASDLTLVGDDATIVDNGDGTFSITPSENFNGYIDVAYSISDGDTPIAANLGLTVDPVNDAPIVSADVAITIEEDGSYTITQEELLQFATDIEDDDMTAIIGEQGDETTVIGTVLDAETGNPVVGADVTLTDNAGHSYTTVTDQSGNYSVNGPVVDQGSVTIEQEGSITSSFLVPAGEDTNGGVTAISEVLEETDMRIVVTWGESPQDMDNHLWLYDTETGNELDHIYYRDMSHDLGEGNVVQQDVDDTNGNGPETITIPNYQDADMHYSVHNYTNRSWDVDGVEDVQVQVFVGDTLVETFTPELPENPSGEHWHVFDIVNGVVVPSQDVGSENSFELPTSEEVLANVNGIDISELLMGDEGGDSGDTGGNEPSVGDVSIENALITDNGDGTYTITPEENFNGEFSISYNVDDGNGGVTPAELDVTVTAVNDLSVIYDHDYTINEDGSLTFTDEQLLAGTTDIDGDGLSVESVNYEGTDGVFTDNGDGTYTFAPNENFNGNIDLTYDVSDGTDVVSANIDVQVVPINDVPVAGSTTYSVEEDGSITLSDAQLLANSSDVEGEVFVSDVSYSGTDGVFTDNGDGTYTFAPNENFNGDISLDVSVMDEDGATAETTAGIDVIAVNDLPVAGSTTYSVDEDNVITVNEAQLLANSSDIEGDVSVSDVSYSGADGIFTDNGDGTYSFAPNENFNGNVSLDVTVADEDGATAQTTAGIDVIAVNDAPVSGDLAYSVDEDGSITLSQEQLLAQASDVDGDDLTAANLTAGDNATVTANDDGSFTITPDADFNGDIDLSFDVSDGVETVQAGVDLTVNPVNDIAVVEDVAYTIEEDGSLTFADADLLAGAADIDGDELSITDVSYTGAEGVFTDNGDGTYSFAPNENFNGEVSLDFSVSDGTETVDANIGVTVTDVNDAPVSGATSYQMNEDGTITLSPEQLIANSSDVDGDVSLDSVSYSGADGILVQNEDGSVTFAPNENFNGDINLDVTVIDDDGATAQTTAGIEVIAVNDAPVAGDLAYSVDEDGSITLSQEQLLAQASDVDGDDLTAANLTAGDNATVTANDDGSFTITPDADFNGDIDLSFDLSDGTETVVATADLTVNPVNDIAVVEDVAYTIEEDGSLTFTDEQLLAGASDIDGDELSVADVSYTGAEGVFTDNGDGTYTFAPNENFNGDVSLDFSVSDGTETVDANIDVTVTDVNDAPVSGATSYQMNEDGTITLSPEQLIANSSDVDGDVSLDSVSYSGADGILVQNEDGSVTFAPNENFNGDINLDVTVIDDDGATAQTTAGIEVLAVNDGPESEDVKLTTAEDSTILITQDMLLAQATDIDNTADELSASGLQIDPSLGELLDNEDGTWSFTPNENFNGDVPMTFNVSDGQETISVDGNIDVTPVNDAPEAPTIEMQGEEDVVMVIDPAYIADQVTDLDGDEISIESITVRSPANATLTQQPDGMYHLVTTQDFNGLVELGYQATDGEEVVEGSLNVDVIPVNDAPFNVGNAMMTTNEDGAFTFDAGDLMNLFGDIDTTDLVVSRIINADGEDGGELTDNGDGTWTFTPTGDFSGTSDLQVVVSDGEFETVLDVPVFVRPVADGAVITTDHDGPLVFGEDETGHLGLNVGLVDDSETLSNLVMTGFPVGFEVTDGEHCDDHRTGSIYRPVRMGYLKHSNDAS